MENEYTSHGTSPNPVHKRQRHRKKKKTPVFKLGFLVYIAVLVVLCVSSIIYVRSSLIQYENSQSGVFIKDFVSGISGGSASSDFESKLMESAKLSKFDDVGKIKKQLSEKLESSSLTYELSSASYDTSTPVYNIYADSELFMTVTLKSVNPQTKLGIMTISDWEIQSFHMASSAANSTVSDYTIKVLDIYKVYVNDIELGAEELTGETEDISQFQYASEYVTMPKFVKYKISGLVFEPSIIIKDAAGNDVKFTSSKGTVTADLSYSSSDFPSAISSKVSPLNIAETWSKLMTADLQGESYGIAQVRKFLIKGSYLDKMAYDYAGSVDITFVSAHVIKSFTSEKVSNFIFYNDNCFSCDVYFEKNMTLTRTGDSRTDVFDNRMFFVNITDPSVASEGWYLVDMQSVIN